MVSAKTCQFMFGFPQVFGSREYLGRVVLLSPVCRGRLSDFPGVKMDG